MKDLRQRTGRASAVLAIGQIIVYGSSLVRNMVLARMLTKADFGTAAALGMVVQLFEFTANLGVARFIIRDPEGANPRFIGTAHRLNFGAGLLSAFAIILGSLPLAALFDLDSNRWAMMSLAIVPLLNGLQHLDVRRLERDLQFVPAALTEAIPQLLVTLLTWPVAYLIRDFRAMLLLLVLKSATTCMVSHLLAETSYKWSRERTYETRMLRFGWPLLVNGFLMFAVTQGDQSLVASFYSVVDLGAFSAAATLALVPTFLFGKVSTSLLLPILANAQNDPILFERRYRQAVHSQCAFAAVCATAMVLGADSLMRIVYGQKYTGNSELLAFLAISTAFRNIRIAPSLAALAKGDSNNQLISNMWRLCGLPFSLVIAWKQCPMYLITVSAICGEIVAALVSFWRLQKRDGISIWISLLPLLWVGAVSLAGSSLLTVIKHMSLPVTILIAALCSLVVGFLTLLMFPPVRPHFTSLITRCLPHV